MPTVSRIVPVVLKPASPSGALVVTTVGGQPALDGVGCYLELEVQIRGEPNPKSGYVISITDIDRAVRAELPGILAADAHAAFGSGSHRSLDHLLLSLARQLPPRLGVLPFRLILRTTPYFTIAIEPAMPDIIHLTRRFDFSAAHRLFQANLSEAENIALFGKCCHPAGHGHNYRVDVTVARPIEVVGAGGAPSVTGTTAGSGHWEAIVEREVIERYDHRHLNIDCPEFHTTNPSVEHIAKAIHERLAPQMPTAGVTLERVCVWETEKTWCAFPA